MRVSGSRAINCAIPFDYAQGRPFASRLIAADVPITSVQKLLGHTSLRTTQLCIRLADTQVERDYHAGIQKVLDAAATESAEGHR